MSIKNLKNKFNGGRVVLDGQEFRDCVFDGTEVVFQGKAPTSLINNQFLNCTWQFEGAAGLTLAFLKGLVAGGARGLVEQTLGLTPPAQGPEVTHD